MSDKPITDKETYARLVYIERELLALQLTVRRLMLDLLDSIDIDAV